MTTTTPADRIVATTLDRAEALVWDADDLADTETGGACRSPQEAKAKAIATLKVLIPGLAYRKPSYVNTWKKALWETENQEKIEAACKAEGLSPHTFKAFCVIFSSFTSWNGQEAVFASRLTIALLLGGRSKITGGAALRVIDRCIAAAVDLGFLSKGFQKKWLKTNDDGTMSWKSGSCIRYLLTPDFGPTARMLAEQTVKRRARRRRDKAAEQAMALKKQHDAEQRAHIETLIVQPPDKRPERPPKRSRTAGMNEALNNARRALE